METIALKAKKWNNQIGAHEVIVTIPIIKQWGNVALHWSIENGKAELDSEVYTLTHIPSLKAIVHFCAGVPMEIIEPAAIAFSELIPDDETQITGIQKQQCYGLIDQLKAAGNNATRIDYYCPHCSLCTTRKYNLQLDKTTKCIHCGAECENWTLTLEPFSFNTLEQLLKNEHAEDHFSDPLAAMEALDYVYLKVFGRKTP